MHRIAKAACLAIALAFTCTSLATAYSPAYAASQTQLKKKKTKFGISYWKNFQADEIEAALPQIDRPSNPDGLADERRLVRCRRVRPGP